MNEDQQQNDAKSPNPVKSRDQVRTYEYFIIAIISLIPYIGLVAFAASIIDGIARRKRGSGGLIWTSFVCMAISTLYVIMLPSYVRAREKTWEAETKSNLHTIQDALERWADDHEGLYPAEINILIEDEYMATMPFKAGSARRMRNIASGSDQYEGNFSYLQEIDDDKIQGYYLVGYGSETSKGYDIDCDGSDDHVIIVLGRYGDQETGLKELQKLLTMFRRGPQPMDPRHPNDTR
jgi:hypothetical protein